MLNSEAHAPACRKCGDELDIVIPEVPKSPVPHAFEQEFHKVTVAEEHEVRRTVDQARKDKMYLDRSIARLESLLRDCRKARGLHKSFEKRHSPLLKSAHRLPNEIWTEIFKITSAHPIESDASDYMFRSATPFSAPLSLSHVSSQWRSIALHTPSIWATIDIFLESASFPSSKLKILNIFLARSASHPLHVELEISQEQDGDFLGWESFTRAAKKNFLRALEIVALQSWRWRTVALLLPSKVFSGPPFPLPSMPQLRSLTLETTNCISERTSWSPIFLTDAPILEAANISNFLPSADGFISMIPWSSLTKVDLCPFADGQAGFECKDILHILRSCGRLQNFTFQCYYGRTALSSITHTTLQDLSIKCRSSWLLPILTAPKLTSLHLDQVRLDNPEDFALFLSHERSPSLKKLKLEDSDLKILSRAELLDHSQIREVEIVFSVFDNDTEADIAALQEFSRTKWQDMRTLSSLQITVFSDKNSDENMAQGIRLANGIAMVAERFRIETCSLQNLTVSVDQTGISDVALETFKYLKELNCSGLSVVLEGEKDEDGEESEQSDSSDSE